MHDVLVKRLGGLSLPRKSVVRLNDRPDMTLDVYRGRKTTMQHLSARMVRMDIRSRRTILMPKSSFFFVVADVFSSIKRICREILRDI